MRLTKNKETIGFSCYAEDKPLSVTVETETGRNRKRERFEYLDFSGYRYGKPSKKEQEKIEKQNRQRNRAYNEPNPLVLSITLGLGLDRVSTRITDEDFQALKESFRTAETAIAKRNYEIKSYEEKVKKEEEDEAN